MTVSQSSFPSLSNHNFLSPNFPQTIFNPSITQHTNIQKNKNEQFSFNSALPFTFLFSLDLHSFNSLKKNYRQNPPIQPLPFPLTMEATSSDDHHNSSSPPIDQDQPITHSSSSPPPSSPRKSIELNPDSLTIEEAEEKTTTEEVEADGENKKEEEDVNKDTSEAAKEEEQPEDQKEVEEEETNLLKLSEEIDKFLTLLSTLDDSNLPTPPEIPISLERFVKLVEIDIVKNNSAKDPSKWLDPDSSSCNSSDPDNNNSSSSSSSSSPPLLESVDRISKLISKLGECHLDPKYAISVNRTSSVLQRAMAFLEEEFRTFLETGSESEIIPPPVVQQTDPKAKKLASFNNELDRSSTASEPGSSGDVKFNGYSPEVTSNLKRIATAMISAGYEAECCQAYSIARRTTFEENLSKLGFEKISIDDIQKMNWESLEGEIATWIRAFKRCITVYFTGERNLCDSVYSDYPNVSASLFSNLTRGVIIQLLNFAEAVAMTKRSAEKLFKFLDMYETMRDLAPQMDEIFSGVDESFSELKAEISTARCRLGEAVVSIFCDLENSIKSDTGKTPVPGGAVHPLTRYTMNYLKYACEYKDTLEQVFIDHKKIIDQSDDREGSEISTPSHPNNNSNNHNNSNATSQAQPSTSPFANQLMNVMDLLDSNLEAKSKLYKDLSLRYIFLMNNGRYIMQKIKGTNGIYHLMGDTWSRKRSSDLRQYHKNYQRETWSKVLGCLKDEGLQVNGKVQKPVLKERFKSFNAMFEEIHKAQSSWIVSDEQLQSELRVSISAVMIPAYRSFLGRFRQYLDSGRQSEKYIKYGPEDIETSIDELFDGNPASMVRRRT